MDQKTTTFESGAGTRVPKWEPGLTKGTWGQKGTQVPISKIVQCDFIVTLFLSGRHDHYYHIYYIIIITQLVGNGRIDLDT